MKGNLIAFALGALALYLVVNARPGTLGLGVVKSDGFTHGGA